MNSVCKKQYFSFLIRILMNDKSLINISERSMQKEEHRTIRVQQNQLMFEVNFKTESCCSIRATDTIEGNKYYNANIEFSKMQSHTIIAILQNKSPKELSYAVRRISGSSPCLEIEFKAEFDFVPAFTEKAILYQTESGSLIPGKSTLSKQNFDQLKTCIDSIEEQLAEPDLKQRAFEAFDMGTLNFVRNSSEKDRLALQILGSNVLLIFLWIFWLEFRVVLVLAVAMNYCWYWFSCQHRHLIKQFELKKGTFRIEASGVITCYNSKSEKFEVLLSRSNNFFDYEARGFTINCNNGYGYPYKVSFLVRVEQPRSYQLNFKKNVQFNHLNIANQVVLIEKVSS